MFKRLSCALISLGVVMALGSPAMAAEETGSIQVTLQNGETVVPDGSVVLHLVGIPIDEDYQLMEAFGGGIVKAEDALSPALAQWLAEMTEAEGWDKLLDGFGSARFRDLEEGLYLIVQGEKSTGYLPMEPMLVQIPCQYQWDVQAYPMMSEITWDLPKRASLLSPSLEPRAWSSPALD